MTTLDEKLFHGGMVSKADVGVDEGFLVLFGLEVSATDTIEDGDVAGA